MTTQTIGRNKDIIKYQTQILTYIVMLRCCADNFVSFVSVHVGVLSFVLTLFLPIDCVVCSTLPMLFFHVPIWRVLVVVCCCHGVLSLLLCCTSFPFMFCVGVFGWVADFN